MTQEDAQTAGMLARNLLCHVTGKTNEQIIAQREMYAGEKACNEMNAAVERVRNGEPLAYVLGQWEFYGMTLHVNKNTLIPRDDTCAVTELALKHSLFLDTSPRIMDLCTGTGCIGLAIANHIKDAKVTLADISADALAVAKKNVSGQKLNGRVSCVVCDALKAAPAFLGKFDMLV